MLAAPVDTVAGKLFGTSGRLERAPDGAFAPSPLNTAVFLLSVLVQLNTFAANYVGEPFTEALRDHRPLAGLLLASYFLLALCAADLCAPLSAWLQLAPPPSAAFRDSLIGLMAADCAAVAGVAVVVK